MFKNRIYCPLGNFSIGLTVISLLSFSNILNAATITIPTDYTTIQAGIDAAIDGDTVIVVPGIYLENIEISKSIVLGSYYLSSSNFDDIDFDIHCYILCFLTLVYLITKRCWYLKNWIKI